MTAASSFKADFLGAFREFFSPVRRFTALLSRDDGISEKHRAISQRLDDLAATITEMKDVSNEATGMLVKLAHESGLISKGTANLSELNRDMTEKLYDLAAQMPKIENEVNVARGDLANIVHESRSISKETARVSKQLEKIFDLFYDEQRTIQRSEVSAWFRQPRHSRFTLAHELGHWALVGSKKSGPSLDIDEQFSVVTASILASKMVGRPAKELIQQAVLTYYGGNKSVAMRTLGTIIEAYNIPIDQLPGIRSSGSTFGR